MHAGDIANCRLKSNPSFPSQPGTAILMRHFTNIARRVDIEPLLAELDAAPEMWRVDTSRQRNIRCQRNTRNIFFCALPASRCRPAPRTRTMSTRVELHGQQGSSPSRWPGARALPTLSVEPSVARPWWPCYRTAGCFRMSMPAPTTEIRDRFHLVLRSAGGSPLTAGDERVVMRPGELWAFNNKARHCADNPSEEPRVHLIFDVLPAPGRGFHVLPLENLD